MPISATIRCWNTKATAANTRITSSGSTSLGGIRTDFSAMVGTLDTISRPTRMVQIATTHSLVNHTEPNCS